VANRGLDEIRAVAAKYPEAEKAFLFGDHEVFRVRKKVFVWLSGEDGETWLSVKLKDTHHAALSLPFTSPAAYGMAKWGWVNATFPKGKNPPMALIQAWLDESYRHTAPKKLLQAMAGGTPAKAAPKAKARRKPARRRASF
jgi:predicted DNA-binding protein (MmcQ/YjbR family)